MSTTATAGRRAPLADAALRIQPDSRLVTLTRQGYQRAFDEIVRRYRSRLVAFAGGVVPAHRAEDVVQDGLARAWLALSESDREIELRPWLYRIVRNGALNSRRDERVHERIDDDFDGVPQPPDVAQRREDLSQLISGLQALPANQREAIVRREMEGAGHEQIAADLNTTPGGVRQLIYRARTTLRDGLGLLVPVPLLRSLLEISTVEATTGAVSTGAAAAGGIGAALKAGTVVAVTAVAVGAGVAIKDRDGGPGQKAEASSREQGSRGGDDSTSTAGSEPATATVSPGAATTSADSGPGPSDDSGGSGSAGDDDGPETEGNSGPGSRPDSGAGDDHSGSSGSGSSGGGSDDADSSGSGSSGSGSSGSGSSGSDSSGSGSSGSGSGGSGSSGSGSSGSGSGGSGSSGPGSGDPEVEEPDEPEPPEPPEQESSDGEDSSSGPG